eukprot:403376237
MERRYQVKGAGQPSNHNANNTNQSQYSNYQEIQQNPQFVRKHPEEEKKTFYQQFQNNNVPHQARFIPVNNFQNNNFSQVNKQEEIKQFGRGNRGIQNNLGANNGRGRGEMQPVYGRGFRGGGNERGNFRGNYRGRGGSFPANDRQQTQQYQEPATYTQTQRPLTQQNQQVYRRARTSLYSAFNDSDFYLNIQRSYFKELNSSIRTKDDYLLRLEDLNILIEVISLLMDKFRTQADIFPVPILRSFLKNDLPIIQSKHDFIGYYKDKVQELQEKSKELKEKQNDARIQALKEEVQQPPDDFTQIRVVPTPEELSQPNNPFLRAIPQGEARFRNSHDYLDLIFRLLREDAICPLRRGYQIMKRQHLLDENDFRIEMRNSGCRLYDNVVIQDFSTCRNSHEMVLTLRIFEGRNQNWFAKRLLNGSLLMISKDNFKTLDFCIVADKDYEEMAYTSQNYKFVDIQVQLVQTDIDIESESESDSQSNESSDEGVTILERNKTIDFYVDNKKLSFCMLESTAYFEAYNHILHKLKEMATWDTLPFQKYLLGLQKNIDKPALFDSLDEDQKQKLQKSIKKAIQEANLDQSQEDALNSCFFKELAIVQGPPGTGKTYVGEHFVKIMLQNKNLWRQEKGPILLVCYTNHALDQFLNLIKKYTRNFIRFGGRCQDEDLKRHHIRDFIRNHEDIRYPYGYKDCFEDLDKIELQIADQKLLFQFNTLGIMNKLVNADESMFDALDAITKQFVKLAHQTALNLFRLMQIEPLTQKELNKLNQVLIKVKNHINKMVEQDSDISVVFWLEIIQTQKYVTEIWQWYKDGNAQEHAELFDDDFDERELDYIHGNMNVKLSFKKRRELYLKIKDKIKILTQQYDPFLQSDYYGEAKTIHDCIQFGSRCTQKNHYTPKNFNPFDLVLVERWQLNNYFLEQHVSEDQSINLVYLASQYEKAHKEMKYLDNLTQIKAIMQADVIAMTTTGCAKFNEILRNIQFSIVIVEEAAEVFEAHIITSLSQHSDHLLLIGDHQQLKPAPAVYELEKKYNLSMSLFERLVKNNYEYTTLSTQRRMRPEISSIVKLIYPNLEDGEKVLNYPIVRGTDKNLFFFDHENQEDKDEKLLSTYNKFEGSMIERFTKYLLQQNYRPERITILSLYMAQSLHIKRLIMEKYPKFHEMRQVKVITVDNFQGEENDIIILSLVRSNASNQIGYLKVSNRVCVALSRAKHGMFIFGNASCLYKFVDGQKQKQFAQVEEQQQLWLEVLNYLKEGQYIGQSLNLCCERHKIITQIQKPEDFQNVPEGGCKLPCNARLTCGHSCKNICHSYELTLEDSTGHKNFKCLNKCEKENPCGHPCSFKCHECTDKLRPCQTMIDKVFEQCKHVGRVKCHQKDSSKCYDQCQIIKPCGHKCQKFCNVDCSTEKCGVNVLKKLPCGHEIELKCFQSPDDFVKNDKFGCPKKCETLLDCGHGCQEQCGSCSKKIFHKTCEVKIDKAYQCGHVKSQQCGTLSVLCQEKCKNQCVHNHCPKKCYEPCNLCLESCQIQCPHSKCAQKCSKPCDKELCTKKCELLLACGHNCIGLCGDQCPQICRVCEPKHETFEIFFGYEDEPESTFVQIDCGHILDSKSLDTYIQTQKQDGHVKLPECPKCKQPIKKCLRYQNSINQTLEDMNEIKRRTIIQHEELMQQYEQLEEKFDYIEDKLDGILIDKQYKVEEVFNLWIRLYKRSSNNESLLKDCAVKLELMSFIVAFVGYIHQYSLNLQSDSNLNSLCHLSIKKIFFLKFVLPKNMKTELRKQAQLIDKEYDFKATFQMVVEALGLGPGHYYKCPKGHYYAIGDCGGAMEESKCPDCGATIGGQNHELVQGNLHAGEFDNSSRPAWDPEGFDQQVLNGEVDLDEI